MAKLPPSDHDDEKPRNKRRYDPRDPHEEKERERGVPRRTGGRPVDDDEDWDEDWELEDDLDDELEDDLDDDFEEGDWNEDDWDGGDPDLDDEDDDR